MASARAPSTQYSPTERPHALLGLLNATTEVLESPLSPVAFPFAGLDLFASEEGDPLFSKGGRIETTLTMRCRPQPAATVFACFCGS
jgi:hypothetical protein